MSKAKHRTLAELKAAGMKIREYMREDEMIDWCKIGVACGEMNAVAEKYRNAGWKDWAAALQTAVTKADRVLNERLAMMEPKAINTLINRRNHSKMIISIDYAKRIAPKDEEKELITVSADDFQDIVEMSIVQTCEGCQRTDHKDCKFHDAYLKLCVPVFDDTGDACPYQYDVVKEATAWQMGVNNKKVG